MLGRQLGRAGWGLTAATAGMGGTATGLTRKVREAREGARGKAQSVCMGWQGPVKEREERVRRTVRWDVVDAEAGVRPASPIRRHSPTRKRRSRRRRRRPRYSREDGIHEASPQKHTGKRLELDRRLAAPVARSVAPTLR